MGKKFMQDIDNEPGLFESVVTYNGFSWNRCKVCLNPNEILGKNWRIKTAQYKGYWFFGSSYWHIDGGSFYPCCCSEFYPKFDTETEAINAGFECLLRQISYAPEKISKIIKKDIAKHRVKQLSLF